MKYFRFGLSHQKYLLHQDLILRAVAPGQFRGPEINCFKNTGNRKKESKSL